MKLFKFFVTTVLLCSSHSFAYDYKTHPEVNWSSDSKVDFCPNANTFDFRNAYWLGALSYFAYWDIKFAQPIISSDPEVKLDLDFAPDESIKPFDIHGLGFGKLKSVFFTSTPALPDDESDNPHLVRVYQPALPKEACIKPDRILCFAGEGKTVAPGLNHRSQGENDYCGDSNLKAYYEVGRLRNIQNLVSGVPLKQELADLAVADKKYIEDSVRKYEAAKGIKVNLDWSDKKTSQRCEIYKDTDDETADTQAGIFENEEAITIAVRGTEPGNRNDVLTDLMALNKISLEKSSIGTGSVHRGFYKAAIVMKKWLIRELIKLDQRSANSIKKPIFVTGHSLGGALANLIMYSLLEYNASVKDPKSRLNLKALYSFGAPRVGDYTWAKQFHNLAQQMGVGLYRLVNFGDPVPNAPCINYSHAGSFVYMDPNSNGVGTAIQSVKAVLNPIDRVLSLGITHVKVANCAYETALYYPFLVKEMVTSHFMTSYFESLSGLRNLLNNKLELQREKALRNGDEETAEQLTYPRSCQKPNIPNLDLDGVDLNYQMLKSDLEK